VIFLLLISGCVSSTTKENFLHNSEAKITVRELANPIADIGSFDTLVSSVINENPFGFTAYTIDGQSHAPIEKAKEIYTARLVYADTNANIVGTNEVDFNTVSRFNSGVAIIWQTHLLPLYMAEFVSTIQKRIHTTSRFGATMPTASYTIWL